MSVEEGKVWLPYRVIVCRFNEINLKSPQYQKRLVSILKSHVTSIFSREKLQIQSILTYQGGMLLFLPTKHIKKALVVTQHIPGIKAFLPAINCPSDIENIEGEAIQYARAIIGQNQTFFVRYKDHANSLTRQQREAFQMRMERSIEKLLKKESKPSNNRKNNSGGEVITLTIETREHGTYIFHENFQSGQGGMPIETKNALFSIYDIQMARGTLNVWQNQIKNRNGELNGEQKERKRLIGEEKKSGKENLRGKDKLREKNEDWFQANHKITVRGSVITPVIFKEWRSSPRNNTSTEKFLQTDFTLKRLASYYSKPLMTCVVPFHSLKQRIKRDRTHLDEFSTNMFEWFGKLRVIEELVRQGKRRAIFSYGKRNIHNRALIVETRDLSDYPKMQVAQMLEFPVFYPLLTADFSNTIPKQFQTLNKSLVKEISEFFEQGENKHIIRGIVRKVSRVKIQGKIL